MSCPIVVTIDNPTAILVTVETPPIIIDVGIPGPEGPRGLPGLGILPRTDTTGGVVQLLNSDTAVTLTNATGALMPVSSTTNFVAIYNGSPNDWTPRTGSDVIMYAGFFAIFIQISPHVWKQSGQ